MRFYIWKHIQNGWWPLGETRFLEDAELVVRRHPQGFITDEAGHILSSKIPFDPGPHIIKDMLAK